MRPGEEGKEEREGVIGERAMMQSESNPERFITCTTAYRLGLRVRVGDGVRVGMELPPRCCRLR